MMVLQTIALPLGYAAPLDVLWWIVGKIVRGYSTEFDTAGQGKTRSPRRNTSTSQGRFSTAAFNSLDTASETTGDKRVLNLLNIRVTGKK